MHSHVIVLSTLALLASGQWTYEDDECRTPDRKPGICQPIYSCQPIISYLQEAPKPLSMSDRQLLNSYSCGFEKSTVKVCCPEGPLGGGGGGGDGDAVSRHRNAYLLPSKTCGILQSDDKILNGNVTALFEFPWMALFGYVSPTEPLGWRCGGTLINDKYVLTAAHCITNLGARRLTTIRLGEYDIKLERDCESHYEGETTCAEPVQDMQIEQAIPHPQYDVKTYANDIGLVRLRGRANTTVDSVKPVCLPLLPSIREPSDLNKGIVTGWGRTENSPQSNVLLKVELPVMPPDECVRRYQKIAAIRVTHQLCAGGINEKDSCGGDSGGPLQKVLDYNSDTRYVQYGVVSFGPNPCSTRGLPGVYTKISAYLEWILDNIKT